MKKIVIVLLVLVVGNSCNVVWDKGYSLSINKTNIFESDSFDDILSIDDIYIYLDQNIAYKKDNIIDNWATAESTYNNGFGDCEDKAILFLNILYLKFRIKGNLILLNTNNRAIVTGGVINHAVVEFDGIIIDPVSLIESKPTIVMFYYEFDELFNIKE